MYPVTHVAVWCFNETFVYLLASGFLTHIRRQSFRSFFCLSSLFGCSFCSRSGEGETTASPVNSLEELRQLFKADEHETKSSNLLKPCVFHYGYSTTYQDIAVENSPFLYKQLAPFDLYFPLFPSQRNQLFVPNPWP